MSGIPYERFIDHVEQLYSVVIYIDDYPEYLKRVFLIKDRHSDICTQFSVKRPTSQFGDAAWLYIKIEEAAKLVDQARKTRKERK